MPGADPREIYRFGEFELDISAYELRRGGTAVRLEQQPLDLLILLVQRRGELVSRADIIAKLWGKDVFVDVETGVHTAARKIRQALGDSAAAPAYLETVAGKGYRFVAPVTVIASAAGAASPRVTPHAESPPRRSARRIAVVVALLALIGAAAIAAWMSQGSPAAPSTVTLAVLPFENLSGDPGQEYLADGLTEEAIASIGQIDPDRVHVIGRTSTRVYKATRQSAAEIGRELGVEYLVEGSIRAEEARLRIMAKLVRVRDQSQIWSASYDRAPVGILTLQRELSAAIAEQIRHRLSPDYVAALGRRHTTHAEAYDLYLRGLQYANGRTPATTRLAIEHFERATALDPNYALAWSALANVHAARPINSDADPRDAAPRARAAAENAVRAAPELAEAQFTLGYVNWMLEWNWPVAERALRRAIELDPAYAMAPLALGHYLSQTGRHGEAAPMMRRARELDPLAPIAHALSSQVAFQAQDYAAAVEHGRQAVVIEPQLWIAHVMLGQGYEGAGQPELALQSLLTAARLSSGNSKAVSMRGHLLAKIGKRAEAQEIMDALTAKARDSYVPPYAFALIHAGLGERDAMFAALDRAYAARDVHMIFLTVDSRWDSYRSDPRFTALLKRCDFVRERDGDRR